MTRLGLGKSAATVKNRELLQIMQGSFDFAVIFCSRKILEGLGNVRSCTKLLDVALGYCPILYCIKLKTKQTNNKNTFQGASKCAEAYERLVCLLSF